MKTIKQTYHIKSPIERVWRALVNKNDIESWGADEAKMDDKEGAEFSLWNGDIYGKNIKVIPQKKLVQEWFAGKWDQPSIVTFELSEENGGTKIILLHDGVPDKEARDIDEGWKDYYLGPLKHYVEKNKK